MINRVERLKNFSNWTGCSKGHQKMDYANVMRAAVELGPPRLREKGYLFKSATYSFRLKIIFFPL